MMPVVRLLKNKEEFDSVVEAAKQDGHLAFCPTHGVMKNGLPVGYFSVGAVPMTMVWLSPKDVTPRESFCLINTMENLVASQGSRGAVVPCTTESPFFKVMESLGFTSIGQFTLFVKDF
jgi:hypothetical protein